MGIEPNPNQTNRTRTHISAKRTEPYEPELFYRPNPNRTELSDWTNRTELKHNAQWASCKNAARNAWETDVSQAQYVTNTCDVLSINCKNAYEVKVLWLLKAIVF